jgi:succinylglutamate desuccinylase
MKKKIAIVGCLHGDELIGKYVLDELTKSNNLNIRFFLGNEKAIKQNKRFIETDLNRCFPGKKDGNHEEKLAHNLTKKLCKYDLVIDIHSTTAKTDPFIIITKQNKKIIDFVKKIPIKNTVFMRNSIASGKALIDHVQCGISLEFNKDFDPIQVKNTIIDTINNIYKNKEQTKFSKQESFEVYDIIKKSDVKYPEINNFRLTKLDNDSFYPILFGTDAYKDILCLKARRL